MVTKLKEPAAGEPMTLKSMAQAYRSEHRAADENKLNAFQLGAMLMECNVKRKIGFSVFQVSLDAEMLTRWAQAIEGYALRDCNVGLNDRQEEQREKIAKQIGIVAAWYDLKAECHGDPRGYVVRLHGDDLVANGWGEGYGVA